MRINSPCYDCPDREPGCHNKCEEYGEYRERYDKMKSKERENKHHDLDVLEYQIGQCRWGK